MKINIVMVEPEIPQNTGNVARTCAATGAKLHLVKPLGFSIDDKHLKRAGLDYWDKLEIEEHDSLEAFLKKYAYKNINVGGATFSNQIKDNIDVGVAAFGDPIKNNIFLVSTKSQNTYDNVKYKEFEEIFLLFGKETKGLPEDLIQNNIKQAIRIPMKEGLRSLNLSNSVAIVTYEVLRQTCFEGLQGISQYFNKN